MGRVDPQVDGHRRNALVGASDSVGLSLDLQAHLLEVGEFLPLAVQELGIFCGRINQLQDQGTPGDDARSSGQEVPAMSWGSEEGQDLGAAAFPPREYLSCY